MELSQMPMGCSHFSPFHLFTLSILTEEHKVKLRFYFTLIVNKRGRRSHFFTFSPFHPFTFKRALAIFSPFHLFTFSPF